VDALPAWVVGPAIVPADAGRGRDFAARTVADVAAATHRVLASEDAAPREPAVDARVKLVGLLVLLIVLAFVRHPATLALAVGVILVAAASLGAGLVFLRAWLPVVAVTALVTLPASLSVLVPGHLVVPLGGGLGLSSQGLTSVALVTGRVACSLGLVLLLGRTTPWWRLLAGLGRLGLPRTLTAVVTMAHRYLVVLAAVVTNTHLARLSRTVTRPRHDRRTRAWVGASAGVLLARAFALTDDVHSAMLARGFDGRLRLLGTDQRLGRRDAIAALAVVAAAAALIGVDRVL